MSTLELTLLYLLAAVLARSGSQVSWSATSTKPKQPFLVLHSGRWKVAR